MLRERQVATPGGEGGGGVGGETPARVRSELQTPERVRNELQALREDQARGMAALREAEVLTLSCCHTSTPTPKVNSTSLAVGAIPECIRAFAGDSEVSTLSLLQTTTQIKISQHTADQSPRGRIVHDHRQSRYRAKMAHARQSRPDSSLGFQVKVLQTF